MTAFIISPPSADAARKALGLPAEFCGCEVCLAGGSCVEQPFASTMEDLVAQLPWSNIGAALRALGLEVTDREPTEEEEDEDELLGEETPEETIGDVPTIARTELDLYRDLVRVEGELRAKGASRHQLYRLRKRVWAAMAALGLDDDSDAPVSREAYTVFMRELAAGVLALKERTATGRRRSRRRRPVLQTRLSPPPLGSPRHLGVSLSRGSRRRRSSGLSWALSIPTRPPQASTRSLDWPPHSEVKMTLGAPWLTPPLSPRRRAICPAARPAPRPPQESSTPAWRRKWPSRSSGSSGSSPTSRVR